MSNRELDRIFRERLGNYELEPPMHLWEHIAATRATARRPARPWVWWSGLLSMLTLSAGILLWVAMGPQAEAVPPAPEESQSLASVVETHVDASEMATAAESSLTAERPVEAVEPPLEVIPKSAGVPASPAGGKHTRVALAANERLVAAEEEDAMRIVLSETAVSHSQDLEGAGASILALDGLPSRALWPVDRDYRGNYKFPENSCRPFSKEKWKLNWYAETYFAPEYVVRSLSPRSKDFVAYADSRNGMEDVRGGFSAGIRMSAVTDFGLSLRSGVQYAQINEVLNFRDPDDMRIIVTNIYDGQGNIIGSDTIYEPGTHIRVSYNRFRLLDVPVMLGYEFQFPRFSMTLHGGPIVNLMFQKKGDILGPEGEPVAISSSENDAYPAFNDRLGLSLGGSIGFNYRLTPNLQFMIEPQFRVVLDPVTRSDYPLRQDYFLTGISLGVRQKL